MEEQVQENAPEVQHTGGHHPVREGEVFNARYQALHELGCGAFATVWLCQDMRKKKNVAVKVLKSREGFAEAAQDELSLLRCVWERLGSHLQICRPYPKGYEIDSVMQEEVKKSCPAFLQANVGFRPEAFCDKNCYQSSMRCVKDHLLWFLSDPPKYQVSSMKKKDRAGENVICLLDDFRMIGENGFHTCLVFEALGPSLQFLMGNYAAQGLPLPFVKKSLQQVLAGLHFLHGRCRIIHADIKPENVLLYIHDKNLQRFLLDAADCGQRTDLRLKAPGGDPGNQLEDSDLMSIEVKIADLGSACWTYKPFSKEIQTQPYRALEVLLGLDYGTPADIWSTGCLAFEMATGECLFNPQPGKYFSRDDDHVARIIELLGRIPPQIAFSWNKSTKFFRRPGALLRISRLVPRSLHAILADRLKWRKHEVPPFTSFLLSALRYAPEKRATAAQCLQHAWLGAP